MLIMDPRHLDICNSLLRMKLTIVCGLLGSLFTIAHLGNTPSSLFSLLLLTFLFSPLRDGPSLLTNQFYD